MKTFTKLSLSVLCLFGTIWGGNLACGATAPGDAKAIVCEDLNESGCSKMDSCGWAKDLGQCFTQPNPNLPENLKKGLRKAGGAGATSP